MILPGPAILPVLQHALLHLLAILPLAATAFLGSVLGWLLYRIPNRRRRTALTNLQLCFPQMPDAARRRLLRDNLIEAAKSVTEIGALWTLGERDIKRLIRRISGARHLVAAMRAGNGLILAAPHMGAWELVGLYCSMHYPITGLFRPLSESHKGGIPCRARQRFGARMVAADSSGIRALYRAIKRGEMVWIMPDQVPASRRNGVFAPFFGVPASTMVLLSRLAIKTGAPVVYAYAERLAGGRGYHLHFLPAPVAIGAGDIDESAAAVNAMVERCARALPQQYLWSYKRFRAAPPGLRPPY
jgi:KDO2-lipid IV(A) lauroyltransferase